MAMGQEIASFYASIGADSSGLQKGLEQTKSSMSGLQKTTSALQGVVTGAFIAIGAAAVAMATSIATTGIQFDALKEQAQVAFTTMLGSGEAAQKMLDDLQAFAAKTPFEFPDLIRASQRLMAMGFAADDVIPTLTAIGDAVAGLGGSAETVDRVTTALGQMNAKGKVSAEEMNQLTEAGIPVWQMLADKIGTTVPEAMKKVSGQSTKTAADSGVAWKMMADGVLETVPKMRGGMDSVAASGVSAATAISAITEGIEKKFGGMMENQSKTWNGIISNIKDGFAQLSGTIMAPFFDMAKEQLAKVAQAIGFMSDMFHKGTADISAWQYAFSLLVPQSQIDNFIAVWEAIENVIEVIKAIYRPIASAVSQFLTWQDVMIGLGGLLAMTIIPMLASLVVSMAPVVGTIAGVVIAVGTLRKAWEHDFLGIRTIAQDTFAKLAKWFEGTGIWKGSINDTLYGPGGIQPSIIIWSNSTKNKIAAWVQWAKDRFEQFKGDVIQTFNIWKDRVIEIWGDVMDPIVDIVTKWAINVKQKIENFVGWIVGDFGIFTKMKEKAFDIWNSLLGWWDDHVQPWINHGREIAQGLWDGVRERWTGFISWWQGEWEYLKSRFQSFFGIHSPSTVFAGYGNDMMAGLANGLSAGQSLVVDAMGNVMTEIKKASEWDSLGSIIGDKQAADFVKKVNVLGANATAALAQGGVATGNPAFAAATMAMTSQVSDPIANLKNNIDNLVSQLNDKGITSTLGTNTRTDLNALSESLGALLAGGSYSAPSGILAPTTPTTPTTSTNSSEMVVTLLKAILAEVTREAKVADAGFKSIVTVLSKPNGKLGDTVTIKNGLK